jgi:nucleotide-binding universal stress UspA family protein
MKILIGMDDSTHSRAALDFVESMRWPLGTQMIVLSVARPAVVAHSLVDAGGITYLRAVEEENIQEHEELVAGVERELRERGYDTQARVMTGDPREAIVETARLEKADLVVVGSHGRTGLDKLMMGSVASHVVTHSPCTVMVVKLPRPR